MPSRNRGNALSGGQAPFVGAKPRGLAGALSMGSHREELQLQQEIGNQAAMGAVGPATLGYMNESALTAPASASSAAKPPAKPEAASAGSRAVPPVGAGLGPVMPKPKPAPRPDLPMPSGYMNESEPALSAPAPASSASKPPGKPPAKPVAKPAPASASSGYTPIDTKDFDGPASSGYTAIGSKDFDGPASSGYTAINSKDFDGPASSGYTPIDSKDFDGPASSGYTPINSKDFDGPAPTKYTDMSEVDFEKEQGAGAEQQASSSYGVYRGIDMPSVSSAVPGNNPDFEMKPMVDGMQAFDTVPIGPQKERMKTDLKSTTHYMDTPEKRANHSRGFDEQGKMINKADGNALNTIGAEKAAMQGSKADRHIFAMDGQGQFQSADALKENRTRGAAAKEAGLDQQERFHHSSFLAGEEVAGAGELQVRDGQVELVSDTSGHYQPGSKQMMQTVQQLEKNNVSMEKLGVEFVGKRGSQNMQASALELLGYADHKPEQAEAQMRTMHGKKDSFLSQIKGMGGSGGKEENLKPSQMKRPKAEAENKPKNDGASDSVYDVYS